MILLFLSDCFHFFSKESAGNQFQSAEAAALREEISALREQVEALRAAADESDEGLGEALAALGAEEAKTLRLVDLLTERGMGEEEIFEELATIEEMMLEEEEEGDGSVGEDLT